MSSSNFQLQIESAERLLALTSRLLLLLQEEEVEEEEEEEEEEHEDAEAPTLTNCRVGRVQEFFNSCVGSDGYILIDGLEVRSSKTVAGNSPPTLVNEHEIFQISSLISSRIDSLLEYTIHDGNLDDVQQHLLPLLDSTFPNLGNRLRNHLPPLQTLLEHSIKTSPDTTLIGGFIYLVNLNVKTKFFRPFKEQKMRAFQERLRAKVGDENLRELRAAGKAGYMVLEIQEDATSSQVAQGGEFFTAALYVGQSDHNLARPFASILGTSAGSTLPTISCTAIKALLSETSPFFDENGSRLPQFTHNDYSLTVTYVVSTERQKDIIPAQTRSLLEAVTALATRSSYFLGGSNTAAGSLRAHPFVDAKFYLQKVRDLKDKTILSTLLSSPTFPPALAVAIINVVGKEGTYADWRSSKAPSSSKEKKSLSGKRLQEARREQLVGEAWKYRLTSQGVGQYELDWRMGACAPTWLWNEVRIGQAWTARASIISVIDYDGAEASRTVPMYSLFDSYQQLLLGTFEVILRGHPSTHDGRWTRSEDDRWDCHLPGGVGINKTLYLRIPPAAGLESPLYTSLVQNRTDGSRIPVAPVFVQIIPNEDIVDPHDTFLSEYVPDILPFTVLLTHRFLPKVSFRARATTCAVSSTWAQSRFEDPKFAPYFFSNHTNNNGGTTGGV